MRCIVSIYFDTCIFIDAFLFIVSHSRNRFLLFYFNSRFTDEHIQPVCHAFYSHSLQKWTFWNKWHRFFYVPVCEIRTSCYPTSSDKALKDAPSTGPIQPNLLTGLIPSGDYSRCSIQYSSKHFVTPLMVGDGVLFWACLSVYLHTYLKNHTSECH